MTTLLPDQDTKAEDEKPKFACVDCGRYASYERRGQYLCENHLLSTADRRAYEHWFVEPNS